jgi:Zn-dependent protease
MSRGGKRTYGYRDTEHIDMPRVIVRDRCEARYLLNPFACTMPPMNQNRSSWAFQVGTVAGIPIRVHLTFLMLLLWLVLGSETGHAIHEAIFVILVFVCVLLHELSHALVAKRFAVQTRDITLYPFGGIASIVTHPTAKAELFIALAGPISNIILAAGLFSWVNPASIENLQVDTLTLVDRLFVTNIALALFNLLPALPMDGGRVLRAVLNLMNVKHATRIAARISQGLCLILAVTALYIEQPMLFVIAFIIFFGAVQETVRSEARGVAIAFTVAEAMVPRERLECFTHGTTVSKALRTALTSLQPLYPILLGDKVIGVVFREDILEHAATQPDEYVGGLVIEECPSIESTEPLSSAFTILEETGSSVLIVLREGAFTGILVHDRVSDFLLLQGIRDRYPKDDDAEWSTPL